MKFVKKNSKILFIGGVLILGVVLLFALGGFNSTLINLNKTDAEVTLVNSEEFNRLAKNPTAFILDVHIPEQTHIPGTDAFISYLEIDENLDKLPEDKETPLLVYCRSGSMSKSATNQLVGLGYKNVYDLSGGINSYKQSNVSADISPESKDLGTVIYGDVEKTTFTLTNFTEEPLNVTRVSTSCGCTTADVVKKQLAPYESTDINVEFDPAFHKDDTDVGELTRTIYIDTDSPTYPQLTANIKANVIKK